MLSATTPLAKCGSKGSEWLLCTPQRRLSSSAARGGHSSTHRAAPETRMCHPAGRSRAAELTQQYSRMLPCAPMTPYMMWDQP